MATVMFQNGRKLTFNPLVRWPQLFLRLDISFSLSNKYADFKKIL